MRLPVEASSESFSVKLYSAIWQSMAQLRTRERVAELDVRGLGSGVYLEVERGEERFVEWVMGEG